MHSSIIIEGKRYFLDRVSSWDNIKGRLTQLRRGNPGMRYKFMRVGAGGNSYFALYVRKIS